MNSQREARSRVLIIDNSEDVLNALDKLLKEDGFDTRTTWSGHEALALIQSHSFDVLLVDDYIADLHVAEFLKRVKSQARQPAVVVMRKSKPGPTDVRRYGSLGASAVVDKRDPEQIRRAMTAGAWTQGTTPKSRVN
jgi:CheY-like chemotaxis protein